MHIHHYIYRYFTSLYRLNNLWQNTFWDCFQVKSCAGSFFPVLSGGIRILQRIMFFEESFLSQTNKHARHILSDVECETSSIRNVPLFCSVFVFNYEIGISWPKISSLCIVTRNMHLCYWPAVPFYTRTHTQPHTLHLWT